MWAPRSTGRPRAASPGPAHPAPPSWRSAWASLQDSAQSWRIPPETGSLPGFGREVLDPRENPGVQSAAVVGGRGEHELAHYLRVPDSDLKGDAGSEAPAKDVGIFDPDVPQQGGSVVGHQLVPQGAISVGRAPMGLQLDGDDPAGLGKGRQDLFEGGADRRESAVQ